MRFIQNSNPRHTKRERKLTREELINAENAWVSAAQFELKRQENFANLESMLGIKTIDGVLRCVGRLEYLD